MQALTMKSYEVVLGVDTHLDTHMGVVSSGAGNLLGTLTIPSVPRDTDSYWRGSCPTVISDMPASRVPARTVQG